GRARGRGRSWPAWGSSPRAPAPRIGRVTWRRRNRSWGARSRVRSGCSRSKGALMPGRRTAAAVAALAIAIVAAPRPAAAAALDGASFRWPWILPFLGLLLSIATGPLLFPRIWHRHYG